MQHVSYLMLCSRLHISHQTNALFVQGRPTKLVRGNELDKFENGSCRTEPEWVSLMRAGSEIELDLKQTQAWRCWWTGARTLQAMLLDLGSRRILACQIAHSLSTPCSQSHRGTIIIIQPTRKTDQMTRPYFVNDPGWYALKLPPWVRNLSGNYARKCLRILYPSNFIPVLGATWET